MDASDDKRSCRNAQRRLAYASMDDEKKASLLAKQRDSCRRRLQSGCSSSVLLDPPALNNSGSKFQKVVLTLLFVRNIFIVMCWATRISQLVLLFIELYNIYCLINIYCAIFYAY